MNTYSHTSCINTDHTQNTFLCNYLCTLTKFFLIHLFVNRIQEGTKENKGKKKAKFHTTPRNRP